MAAKKTPVVAVESGKIKFWTTSVNAGCMRYLYGDSGTTYLYIHLNSDLTMKNANRGNCVLGIAYARGLKDGAKVQAGQMAYAGEPVVVWTQPALATIKAMLGVDGALIAALVQLG